LVYITAIWYILWSFDNLVVLWYILSRFGTLGIITKNLATLVQFPKISIDCVPIEFFHRFHCRRAAAVEAGQGFSGIYFCHKNIKFLSAGNKHLVI
jgi:hypothetical protein